MDVIDIAEEHDSVLLENQIKEVQRKAREEHLEPTGFCHNCESPCEGLFCDKECRDDYEKYMAALKRNGKLK